MEGDGLIKEVDPIVSHFNIAGFVFFQERSTIKSIGKRVGHSNTTITSVKNINSIHKNISAFAIIGCAARLNKFDGVVEDCFLNGDIFGRENA